MDRELAEHRLVRREIGNADVAAAGVECAARLEVLIRRIDPKVSGRDVALLVGLHIATAKQEQPAVPAAVAELLAQELALFSQQATGGLSVLDLGAQPLDPDSFFTGT